jgi:hypothetical protein
MLDLPRAAIRARLLIEDGHAKAGRTPADRRGSFAA